LTARSDLVVLVITDGAEEDEGSSKAILTAMILTAEVWFLLPLGLPRGVGASMVKSEAGGEESGGSETVASLSFVFYLSLCLASRSAAFAARYVIKLAVSRRFQVGWGYPSDCSLDDGYEARIQPRVWLPDGRHDDEVEAMCM